MKWVLSKHRTDTRYQRSGSKEKEMRGAKTWPTLAENREGWGTLE